MPEVRKTVVPVEVTYICDACNQGMMELIGSINRETGEAEHECLICEHRQTFQWTHYPRIEHMEID